jgi:hypothetical protein
MIVNKLIKWILLAAVLHPGFSVVSAETLRYEASYKGPFSAGKNLPIAAVQLEREKLRLPALGAAIQITMSVTSEPYAFVEKHFPFRVRYRSIYSLDKKHVLALEKYEKTSRVKHEIDWIDSTNGQLLRFRHKGKKAGERLFPVSLQKWLQPGETFEFHKYSRHGFEDGLIDRLYLLQALRRALLEKGSKYAFTVTDGKHLYHYRVRVQGRQRINIGGKQRNAWKLRFDAVEEGEQKPAHRPLYVWLADDAQRTPLLFEHRHPLGRFLISLSTVQ